MSYLGMNSQTGRTLSDDAHITQSIKDILLTPVGSRIERRDYGSMLFFFIDQPNLKATQLKMMSATVMALAQFEPRIQIDAMQFSHNNEKLTLSLTYYLNSTAAQRKTTSIEVQ